MLVNTALKMDPIVLNAQSPLCGNPGLENVELESTLPPIDVFVASSCYRKFIEKNITTKSDPTFQAMMGSDKKRIWRKRWLSIIQEEGIQRCNFVTLPGPLMLDVKQASETLQLCSVSLFEQRLETVKSIINCIKDRSWVDQPKLRGSRIKRENAYQLPKLLFFTRFELMVNRYSRTLLEKLASNIKAAPTVICLDFCGAYDSYRHNSILRFIQIFGELPQVCNKRVVMILNFASPFTVHTKGLLNLIDVSELRGQQLFPQRFTHAQSVFEGAELFGPLLEDLAGKLSVYTDLKNVNLYEPFHYQNGVHSGLTWGYTTNVLSYNY